MISDGWVLEQWALMQHDVGLVKLPLKGSQRGEQPALRRGGADVVRREHQVGLACRAHVREPGMARITPLSNMLSNANIDLSGIKLQTTPPIIGKGAGDEGGCRHLLPAAEVVEGILNEPQIGRSVRLSPEIIAVTPTT